MQLQWIHQIKSQLREQQASIDDESEGPLIKAYGRRCCYGARYHDPVGVINRLSRG